MVKNLKSKSVIVWSLLISILVLIASLSGLFDPSIYSQETMNWALQAKGQDVGNLLAVPMLLICGYLYYRGSVKAALLWLGTLLYLIYAYIVYAVAVHFNVLFLVYVAILGLSTHAVMFNVGHIKNAESKLVSSSARCYAAYTIMAIGILFSLLWISEIIPALIAGSAPQSTIDAGLWVNPIHVIDLAVVLPGFIITGYLSLRNKSKGLLLLAPWLAFSALMGLSIVAAMIMMMLNGFSGVIPPTMMVGLVVIMSIIALYRYLTKLR